MPNCVNTVGRVKTWYECLHFTSDKRFFNLRKRLLEIIETTRLHSVVMKDICLGLSHSLPTLVYWTGPSLWEHVCFTLIRIALCHIFQILELHFDAFFLTIKCVQNVNINLIDGSNTRWQYYTAKTKNRCKYLRRFHTR